MEPEKEPGSPCGGPPTSHNRHSTPHGREVDARENKKVARGLIEAIENGDRQASKWGMKSMCNGCGRRWSQEEGQNLKPIKPSQRGKSEKRDGAVDRDKLINLIVINFLLDKKEL